MVKAAPSSAASRRPLPEGQAPQAPRFSEPQFDGGANEYAFMLLLGPGDEALIEFPAYDILPNLALFTGAFWLLITFIRSH